MDNLNNVNFNFSYTNTAADISAFHVYSFTGSPHFKRNILNGRMFVLVYVIAAVLYAKFCVEHPFDMWLLICSMVLTGILWYFLFPHFYRISIKDEAFAKQKHGRLKLPLTKITIADGQFFVEREGQNIVITAENVTSVVFASDYIYIILTKEEEPVIIPHSAMNEEQMSNFSSYLTDTFSDKIIRTGGESR